MDQKGCHFCKKDFTSDGSSLRTQGKSALEIPLTLPCEHVLGSVCLGQWLRTNPADSCPLCRRQLYELESSKTKGTGAGGQKIGVLPVLLEYGLRSVEAGQVAGFEFNYAYTGPSEILRLTIKENPQYRGGGRPGVA